MFTKKLNQTSVDQLGYMQSLSRGKNESLIDFQARVSKSTIEVNEKDKRFFERSLGYITPLQDENIFEIKLLNPQLFIPRIQLSSNNVYVWKNSSIIQHDFVKKFEEIKFLTDFKGWLESLKYNDNDYMFEVKIISERDDWEYLYTKNIMKFDTYCYREKYEIKNLLNVELPENHITNINSNNSNIELKDVNSYDNLNLQDNTKYSLEDGKVFFRSLSDGYDYISYNYSNFPLIVKWLPFEYFAYNDKDFNQIALDKCLYENNQEEEHKKLNQTGAYYYNQLLRIHNNYWSKE
jgi:hypothetical protein